jgi:hypothetical protein
MIPIKFQPWDFPGLLWATASLSLSQQLGDQLAASIKTSSAAYVCSKSNFPPLQIHSPKQTSTKPAHCRKGRNMYVLQRGMLLICNSVWTGRKKYQNAPKKSLPTLGNNTPAQHRLNPLSFGPQC